MPLLHPSERSLHRPLIRPLRLGSRASPLALAQAEATRDALCAAHGWGAEMVEIIAVTASGDKVQDRPLAEIGGKALWTKELDVALLGGEIDFAVHSAKDVETRRPPAITIAATLPRADVADVLVGAASLADLPPGARVGTSAPRRAAQALHLRPDCMIVPFRGNVATRLARLERGEADATLLAAAGLARLGLNLGHALPPGDFLPAPAQGIIAIEARADDAETRALLAAINHPPTHAALLAERRLLETLGGSCHSAVAVWTQAEGAMLHLSAAIFSPDGRERIAGEARFAAADAAGPAALASDLLARASPAITRHFRAE